MKHNYEMCLEWVLVHEGGFVNHPKDPGGATNFGITQATYNGWLRRNGKPSASVRDIPKNVVEAIYKRQYWDAVRGDDLPSGLDYAVFDFAVNSGVNRASQFLQRILGVEADGVIGEQTLGAVYSNKFKIQDLVETLCENRMAFLRKLRHWPTFKNGWTRRVMGKQNSIQPEDSGVIDRAYFMVDSDEFAARVTFASLDPIAEPQAKGEGSLSLGSQIVEAVKAPEALGTGGVAATIATQLAGSDSPAIQNALALVLVLGAVFLIWYLVKVRNA